MAVFGSGLVLLGAFAHLTIFMTATSIEGAPALASGESDPASNRRSSEAMSMSKNQSEVLRLLKGEEFQGLAELTRLSSEDVVPVLLERATEDPDALIRQRSVIALGAIGDPGAVPVLQERLKDASAPVVMSAVDALVRLDHGPSAVPIVDLLASDDASVRQKAADALGTLAGPESEPALRALLQREPEPFVRETVARSLDRIWSRAAGRP
jgi:HEAT repeat protein